ncbi:putative RND superfamily exporter protein [Pseudomonas nitritireducens]|uniref:Putative RND superfamily exporter protein n=1 Tax=Pseudomonas nitroreducens TaxID=46680 RepID=A0A7W7NZB0_PSENT|nr:MMPL family transporter [Pseudomonas nitritireducens]MBB4862553.1 putative RND superfamily exporter protein [Pseudomonas nitritireducens]
MTISTSDRAGHGPRNRREALMRAYADWVTGNPWRTVLLSLLLMAALASGLMHLTFRSDNRVFFGEDNPELQTLDHFDATYGRDDTLLFVVTARDGDLFTSDRLKAINELTDAAWNLPETKRVDSPTNFQRALAVGDDISIDQLARSGDVLSDADARRLKAETALEPMLIGRLLSADARTGMVAVSFLFDPARVSDQTLDAMAAGKALSEKFSREHPDLQVGLSGSVALDDAFVEASTYDSVVLLPVMVVVLLGIIAISIRSFAGALATFCVVILGTLSALGTSALMGIPLSSPSVAAPNIILTIACCDCIHLCSGMMRLRREGLSRREAVSEILIECGWPVTLTMITTAIGFLSMVFSAVPPFAHLGVIVALGSVLAWFLTMTFLPALLCILPWKGPKSSMPAEMLSLRIAELVMKRPGKVLAAVVVVAVVLCSLAFSNTLDDRYVRYFDQSFEFRQATDRLNQDLGGFYTLEFSLDSGEADGITQPEYLSEVSHFADWLRQQPGVTHVHGLPDVMMTVNRAMNGGGQDQYRLPDSRDVTAQYLALYEMSLPFGMDLKNQLTADKRFTRLSVSLGDVSTASMADLQVRAEDWARHNAPLLASSAQATGTSLLFAHIGNRNIQEMYTGIFSGILVVWVIFALAFRSISLSFIGTIANTVPSLATLGAWALVNGEVGMAVATVASVTFGVIVDDTIHMLSTYARLRRHEKLSPEDAVRGAFRTVGPGMIAMTLALSSGFACLTFSGFQINSWMGLMASMTILIAVLFDLLFIPAVLLVFANWQRARGKADWVEAAR